MKKAVLLMATMAGAGILATAAVQAEPGQDADGAAKTDATKIVKVQTVCPVMGGKINKRLYVDYEGKRIYACCAMCLPKLKADPAKYVKKLEEQGVTLEKTPAKKHGEQ